MDAAESVVELVRGAVVESRHRVSVAVVDAEGTLRARAGDPELATFIRSAAKPFQALPLVDDGAVDRFGITGEELAVCCGSHAGTPSHLAVVESLLARVGGDAAALVCGPHAPFDAGAARELAGAGLAPGRLHNNCSGKHAGMVALARAHGWEPAGYERTEHPVQGRVMAEVSRWSGVPSEALAIGVDGCGVACFGMPLRNMALAYARLAAAARAEEPGAGAVVGAMVTHPAMVAGEGKLCTDLVRRVEGRIFAKVGAEGVYCAGVPGAEIGVAIKVEDGAMRAAGPAILAVLREADLISEDDFGALYSHAFPEVRNTRGEVVGQLRPRITLRPPHA